MNGYLTMCSTRAMFFSYPSRSLYLWGIGKELNAMLSLGVCRIHVHYNSYNNPTTMIRLKEKLEKH